MAQTYEIRRGIMHQVSIRYWKLKGSALRRNHIPGSFPGGGSDPEPTVPPLEKVDGLGGKDDLREARDLSSGSLCVRRSVAAVWRLDVA